MRIFGFLLRDRISISRWLGAGGEGDVWSNAEINVKAHVESKRRLVKTFEGESTTLGDAVAYIRPEVAPVPVGSRVDWGGKTYRVAAAGAVPDEVSPSHRELILESR